MDDIIETMPWQCCDKDCEVQWHKAGYWINDDGYTVDWYSDGDHEECDESDLPCPEKVRDAWVEYSRYVLKTGTDPLAEFMVKRHSTREQSWHFKFSPSLIGWLVVRAKHAGKEVDIRDLPSHVRKYLNLPVDGKKRPVLGDFSKTKEARDAMGQIFPNPYKWNKAYIAHRVYSPEKAVAADLRRAARKHIRRTHDPLQ